MGGDGQLTEKEIVDGLRQWCVLSERYKQLNALDMSSSAGLQQAKVVEKRFLQDFGGAPGELERLAAQPTSVKKHKSLAQFLESARMEQAGEGEKEEDENQ